MFTYWSTPRRPSEKAINQIKEVERMGRKNPRRKKRKVVRQKLRKIIQRTINQVHLILKVRSIPKLVKIQKFILIRNLIISLSADLHIDQTVFRPLEE